MATLRPTETTWTAVKARTEYSHFMSFHEAFEEENEFWFSWTQPRGFFPSSKPFVGYLSGTKQISTVKYSVSCEAWEGQSTVMCSGPLDRPAHSTERLTGDK